MRFLFSLALGAVLFPSLLPAQELRGTVRGNVTDSTGAVVAGAKLALRNAATGVSTERATSPTGDYLFDLVLPGRYSLTATMDGFRSFVQENILVQTRSDITVNARLELGSVSETVRVTESPVAVQFNKTTMETTLDTKMSNSLPIIHRNPFLLLQLDPQVTFTSTSQEQSPFHHWAGSRLDVGGGTQLKNDILVDGVPNTWGPKTNYVPPMDSVSELNVQQNATDAEFGHSAGGIVSLQMKGGSNEFHGSAYYFGRNPKLNARPDSTTPTPSLIRHSVWGVTAGNAIVKNKVFNYISYEGQNLREPINLVKTLPTALEREGDFSRTLFLNAGQTGLKPIFDPFTTRTAGATITRMPFPGNVIPKSQMDPTSLIFLKDIWTPNGPGDDVTQVNNYRLTFARVYDYYNWSNRTDWNVNDKWRVFGRFSRYHTNVLSPNPPGTPAASTGGSERNSMTAAGDAIWTVNATTVINFRGSYGKPVDRFIDPIAQVPSMNQFFPQNPTFFDSYAKSLPVVYYPGLNLGGGFGRGSYWYSAPDFWNGQAKLSTVKGKHAYKYGGEFRTYRGNSSLPQPLQFTFPAANTANTYVNPNVRLSGSEWATFLLGAIGENSRARNTPIFRATNTFWAFYFQDDYKVSKNLTLNLGLRWEYDGVLRDPQGRFSRTLDLNNPIPEFQGAGAPVLPGQVMAIRGRVPQYNGAWIHTSGPEDGTYAPPKVFMPRFGIAWRLSDKMSFRAGYSRYSIMPSVDIEGGINLNDNPPYTGYQQDSFPLPTVQGVPQARFSNPWANPNPLTPAVERRLGRYTELGSTAQSIIWNQKLGNAYNDRFNLSLQRQVWNQIVVDFTYFLNFGFNQRYQKQLNNIDPRFAFQHRNEVNAQVNNPFYQVLPFEKFPGGLRNIQRIPVNDLLRPYPHYNAVTQWFAEGVHRRYQSIQIKAQRPFTGGFNFLMGYNYNNARNDEYYDGVDAFLDNLTLQNSPNARHKFNVGGIYELPFGKGRKYLNSMNRAANFVLGGWAMSGIYQGVSGEFLRTGGLLVSGNPSIPAGQRTRDRWFDVSKLTRLPDFTRRTNPLQWEGFTGPGVMSLDLTLGKDFPVTERVVFELKMESYNLPNRFNGGNPNLNPDSSLVGRIVSQRNTYFGRQFQYTGRIRW